MNTHHNKRPQKNTPKSGYVFLRLLGLVNTHQHIMKLNAVNMIANTHIRHEMRKHKEVPHRIRCGLEPTQATVNGELRLVNNTTATTLNSPKQHKWIVSVCQRWTTKTQMDCIRLLALDNQNTNGLYPFASVQQPKHKWIVSVCQRGQPKLKCFNAQWL